MATVTDVKLSAAVNERLRPRAETIIGIAAMCQDDLPTLTALAVPDDDTVLDDGANGLRPVTGVAWHTYLGLLATLQGAVGNPAIGAALAALRVRGLDTILGNMQRGDATGLGPVETALRGRVRPIARMFRALKPLLNDDVRQLWPVLQGLDPADLLDTGRPELAAGHNLIPVGLLQAFVALEQGIVGESVSSEAVATAIDILCGTEPLEVQA